MGGGVGSWGSVCGGQGGCERRIEIFEKIQKEKYSGWVRGSGGGHVSGGGGGGGGVQHGRERNVGGSGNVGYGGYEPRIEGNVQCTQRYCTILRKLKNRGGGGGGAIFEPKTLSMYLKKKEQKSKKKKFDRAGIRTHDLRVRKSCSLIH